MNDDDILGKLFDGWEDEAVLFRGERKREKGKEEEEREEEDLGGKQHSAKRYRMQQQQQQMPQERHFPGPLGMLRPRLGRAGDVDGAGAVVSGVNGGGGVGGGDAGENRNGDDGDEGKHGTLLELRGNSQDELWTSAAWTIMMQRYRCGPFGDAKLKYNLSWVLCEGYWRTTPLLIVAVTELTLQEHEGLATLRDPSGSMQAVVHREVMDDQMQIGIVLILKDVSVFNASKTQRYLNLVGDCIVDRISPDAPIPSPLPSEARPSKPTSIYERVCTRVKRPSQSKGGPSKEKKRAETPPPTRSINVAGKRQEPNQQSRKAPPQVPPKERPPPQPIRNPMEPITNQQPAVAKFSGSNLATLKPTLGGSAGVLPQQQLPSFRSSVAPTLANPFAKPLQGYQQPSQPPISSTNLFAAVMSPTVPPKKPTSSTGMKAILGDSNFQDDLVDLGVGDDGFDDALANLDVDALVQKKM